MKHRLGPNTFLAVSLRMKHRLGPNTFLAVSLGLSVFVTGLGLGLGFGLGLGLGWVFQQGSHIFGLLSSSSSNDVALMDFIIQPKQKTSISFPSNSKNAGGVSSAVITSRTGLPLLHRGWDRQSKEYQRQTEQDEIRQRLTMVEETTRTDGLGTELSHPTTPMELLGFIRISKTASTSLLTWAANVSHNGPHYQCFLGPMASAADGTANTASSSSSLRLPSQFHESHFLDCAHRVYERTVSIWNNIIIPQLMLSTTTNTTTTTTTSNDNNYRREDRMQPARFGLRLFTIVRDQFDRLVSYFHFARKIYPTWSYASTKLQNEAILNNDLEKWMELLATEEQRSFHLPYQKGALIESKDWDLATQWIQPKIKTNQTTMIPANRPKKTSTTTTTIPANIFVVLLECFEASVWLQTETFPNYFDAEATERYLNIDPETRNRNTKYKPSKESEALPLIRRKAKVWFAKDFDFYEAAMQQFKQRLLTSRVDPHLVQSCLEKLDS